MHARLRGFGARLSVIVAVGLAIRLVYALALAPDPAFLSDANFFHLLANLVGDGRGFIHPFSFVTSGVTRPTAEHPPLYTLVLAVPSALGATSYDAHRVVSCLLGTGTLAAVGYYLTGEPVSAIATGLTIASYSLVDKAGVARLHPVPYMLLLEGGCALAGLPLLRFRRDAVRREARGWPTIVLAAVMSALAYTLVLFAFRLSKTGYVVAARELSIVLSAVIGSLWLREGRLAPRLAGAAIVLAGVACIGLAR